MTTIQVDVADLLEISDELTNAADLMKTGAARAVNTVASETRKESVRTIISQVRLTQNYVDSKVNVVKDATPDSTSATLEVVDEPVLLASFGTEQATKSNVWTEAKYQQAFGSLATQRRLPGKNGRPGMLAPWIPRTGDPLRLIPKGQKADGLRIRVSNQRTGQNEFGHMFLMPIKSGLTILGGQQIRGRFGAFEHPKGGGKAKAKYGPSVFQVSKGVWEDAEPSIADRLQEEVTNQVSDEFVKELKAK